MDFEFDFENVIKDFNTFTNFTEYDETEWDYLGDDEFYERTKDWNINDECSNNCRCCKIYKCRCDSCASLVEEDNKWYCDEYEDFCENITMCNEFH